MKNKITVFFLVLIVVVVLSCVQETGVSTINTPNNVENFDIEKVQYGQEYNDYFLYVTKKGQNSGGVSISVPKQSGKTTNIESTIQEQNPNRIIEASAIIYEDSTIIVLKK